MTRVLTAVALLVVAAGVRAGDPAAEAAKSYRIETRGTTAEVKAGGKGTLVLAIVPVAEVHVHPQAPLKITLEARGLTLEKTSLGHKDAVDPKAEAPRFEIPFVAAAAGKHGGQGEARLLHLLRPVVREADPRRDGRREREVRNPRRLAAPPSREHPMRVVYGLNPVREVLRAGGEGLSELWLAEGGHAGRGVRRARAARRAAGAKVRTAPRAKLERLAGTDRHQGVVALVADFRYAELDEVLAAARASGRPPSSSSWTASRTRTTSARSSAPPTRSAPTASSSPRIGPSA